MPGGYRRGEFLPVTGVHVSVSIVHHIRSLVAALGWFAEEFHTPWALQQDVAHPSLC